MFTFGDYIIYVDESGDHGLASLDPEYPIFVLAFCIFRKADYAYLVVPCLAQLSQLADKSEYYQGEHCESLHYRAGVWTGTMLAGAVMRGGGCGGRSSLSCLTRSFCSAPSSV